MPDGVTGELYIAGAQLARGYLNRADLSADRFVADPFGPDGARMYRSGDLVRWSRTGDDADPTLVYMGRSDFQVKVRGLRIELEEIERVLGAVDDVDTAVVTVHSDPTAGEHIVAYLVPEASAALDTRRVLDAASADLPSYMLPTVTVVLDELPLNINGKLDRKALPTPDFSTATADQPPRGPVEEIVAGIVADVVGAERVGAFDSFFAVGGNSLSATRVIARVNTALGSALSVRDLFTDPTVAGLAAAAERSSGTDRPVLAPMPRPDTVPLSPAQARMWFINQFDTTSAAYNIRPSCGSRVTSTRMRCAPPSATSSPATRCCGRGTRPTRRWTDGIVSHARRSCRWSTSRVETSSTCAPSTTRTQLAPR